MIESLSSTIPSITWDDLEQVTEVASATLTSIASDKSVLRALVLNSESDPALFRKCEEHRFGYKLVLWEDAEKGFRLRLHISREYEEDRPHNHRFNFVTLILHGRHRVTWYEANQRVDDSFDVSKLVPTVVRYEVPGSLFTTHHEAIHSAVTPPDIVALVLRGPAIKERAIVARRASNEIHWRVGEHKETPERRAEVRMTPQRFKQLVNCLEDLSIL